MPPLLDSHFMEKLSCSASFCVVNDGMLRPSDLRWALMDSISALTFASLLRDSMLRLSSSARASIMAESLPWRSILERDLQNLDIFLSMVKSVLPWSAPFLPVDDYGKPVLHLIEDEILEGRVVLQIPLVLAPFHLEERGLGNVEVAVFGQ